MNTNRTGAAVIGAVVLLVTISGCAGVRAQLETESGASGASSLQLQQDSARREAAIARSLAHAPGPQSTTLQDLLRDAEHADRAEAATNSVSVHETIRAAEQAERTAQATARVHAAKQSPSAAEVQGQRLAEYAEQFGDGDTQSPSAAEVQGQRLAEYAEQVGQSDGDDVPTPTPQPRPISPRNR